jgi:hypothetical protein
MTSRPGSAYFGVNYAVNYRRAVWQFACSCVESKASPAGRTSPSEPGIHNLSKSRSGGLVRQLSVVSPSGRVVHSGPSAQSHQRSAQPAIPGDCPAVVCCASSHAPFPAARMHGSSRPHATYTAPGAIRVWRSPWERTSCRLRPNFNNNTYVCSAMLANPEAAAIGTGF